MKIIFFERALTSKYIRRFLRKRGIVIYEYDELDVIFKLYGYDWILYYDDNRRLRISVIFGICGSPYPLEVLKYAANQLNSERYGLKLCLKNSANGPQCPQMCLTEDYNILVGAFEAFCYSISEFKCFYEFAIFGLVDALENYVKLCDQLNGNTNTKNFDKPKTELFS